MHIFLLDDINIHLGTSSVFFSIIVIEILKSNNENLQ
jgi:hypothetical protein